MPHAALVRLAGVAAIIAGVLRTGAAFFPASEPSVAHEWFFFVADILLQLGVCGVFAYEHVEGGVRGFLGFLPSVIGIEMIGGPDGTPGEILATATGLIAFVLRGSVVHFMVAGATFDLALVGAGLRL